MPARHIGRGDHGGTRKREQPRLGADEDAHALGQAHVVEQADQLLLLFEVVEQHPHPLQVLAQLGVAEQIGAAAHDQGAALALAGPAPAGQPLLHQAGGGVVQLAPGRLELGPHLGLGFGQGAPLEARVEEVGGLLQRRRRHPERGPHQPVLHRAVGQHDDGQGLFGGQGHELHVLDAGLPRRRHHHARPAGQPGEQGARLVHRLLEVAALGDQPRLDGPPLVFREVADLQQTVHEQPQAGVGRHPAGAGVGRAQEAELGQVLHGVADRGRRQGDARPGHRARADRLPGLEVVLDHPPQDVARSGVKLGQAGVALRRERRLAWLAMEGRHDPTGTGDAPQAGGRSLSI